MLFIVLAKLEKEKNSSQAINDELIMRSILALVLCNEIPLPENILALKNTSNFLSIKKAVAL